MKLVTTLILCIVGTLVCATSNSCDGDLVIQDDFSAQFAKFCSVVRGSIAVSNSSLTEISLPFLREIVAPEGSQAFQVSQNPSLISVELPSLALVTGYVDIFSNPNIERINLGSLTNIKRGGLFLTSSSDKRPGADELDGPSGGMNAPNKNVKVVNLSGLKLIDGNLTLLYIDVFQMQNLTGVTSELVIAYSSITNFSLPLLAQVGTLSIKYNPNLAEFAVPALASIDGALYLSNNPKWKGVLPEDWISLTSVDGSVVIDQPEAKSVQAIEFNKQSLKTIRGGFMSRFGPLADDVKLSCADLQQEYKASGIVQGNFECSIEGRDSAGTNAAGSVDFSAAGFFLSLLLLSI